jgi:hypothetical protein
MPTVPRYLAIYLNDHLAGATAGFELARRAAGEHREGELGALFRRLVGEIAADRQALRDIMASLGVGEDRAKIAAAWVGEKVGRLKLNGHLLDPSPLSPLVELEGLTLGITGKLALWQALLGVADAHGLDAARLRELAGRAERQQGEVQEQRMVVARRALA